jgi:hypothetical protein
MPDQGDGGYRAALTQEYGYTLYQKRGNLRKLIELNQFLDYERLDLDGEGLYEAVALTGTADYYPVSWTRLGSKVKWQNDFRLGSSDVGFGLYADLTFSLLSVGMDYEYGMRTADNTGAILDRDEQRWNIAIRKIF